MITGTFNGWNIVAMPASPVPKSIEFTAQDTVAVSTSPFTGQQQVQDWQASWLEASVSMPPMTYHQALPWIAFMLELRGQACAFQIGDPHSLVPQGSAAGTPLVNSAGQTGYLLTTKGWTANAQNVLLPGDWVQLGYRLYRNLDPVNTDASGNATLTLWPQIRESPADATPLTLNATTGLFRLAGNQRKWSAGEARVYGFEFQIREAV